MIQEMKKLTFLITGGEYDKFISDIRALGVVHVEDLQHGATSAELQNAIDSAARIRKAIQELNNAASNYTTTLTYSPKDINLTNTEAILNALDSNLAEEVSLKHEIEDTEKKIETLAPWGDIDWSALAQLEESGMKISFFTCPTKMFKGEWVTNYHCVPVCSEAKREWFVAFNADPADITAQPVEMPKGKFSDYYSELEAKQQRIRDIHEDMLRASIEDMPTLTAALKQAEGDIDLSKVHLSHESILDDHVRLIVGWTLAEKCNEIVSYLDANHICYELTDPAFDDDVPVQIRNNKFAELFEPILRMYSLPNYHDIDPLPLMAPFFMLFFGLCMGDAGYGMLIAAVSIAIMVAKPEMKKFGMLGTLLGIMTIICGGITGSFFGIDLAKVDWEWIKPIQPYFVNDSMKQYFFDYSPMMVISVIIGLVQVLIGMTMAGMKAWKNYGFIYGIGKFSWVTALVSAVCIYGLPMFGVELPAVLEAVLFALIGVSAFGIYFLNNPSAYIGKKPLGKALGVGMNLGGGLWATYGMSTGLLGDLLSYIRLFALGLTGGVLGSVFNTLAMDMSPNVPVAHEVVMLIILLLGHGINFGLCMISSFVHPMRLTFVEYFKNAEFDGGGKEYKPFALHS